MDTRLLKHYEGELAYLREMGAEFATAFPKIASRLGMNGTEVLDPYVERLLEGVAFLSARVQLELELQFPTFTSQLLEIVYPHYLAPTPSMTVVQFVPDAGLTKGFTLPRGTVLRSAFLEGEQTPCQFQTSQDCTLWPVEIAEAEYIDGRGELVAAGIARDVEARAAIRLRLRRIGGEPISELDMDSLTLFFPAGSGANWTLHELFCSDVAAVHARSTDRRADWSMPLVNGAVVPRGMEPSDALLPVPRRSFDGYRLLQEYFAMPERFHFVDLKGIGPALGRAGADEVDIYVVLRNGRPEVAPAVSPAAFALHATPAVNLFQKRCDRIQISGRNYELQVLPDRTAPLDYEVIAVEKVAGISDSGQEDVEFLPFYSPSELTAAGSGHPAYFTLSRRMRQRSEGERLKGVRTSYLGSETYLTLVDARQAPYSDRLEQLSVMALCSNRDLPLLLPGTTADIFHLPDGGPVASIRTLVAPTKPRPTLAQGDAAWRLISHLSLNYLSITDGGGAGGAAALRELVGIYAPLSDRITEKQIEGLVSVGTRPIVRRLTDELLSTAVRGIEITLTFDESYFEGTSVYCMAAVLERFFCRYVTINSFTETVLRTSQRGEVVRWRPLPGRDRVI